MTASGRQRSGLLRRWEDLPPGVQVAVVGPVAWILLFVIHLTLLNQPVGRAVGYAFFWGILATGAIVGATRSERARRLREEQERPDD